MNLPKLSAAVNKNTSYSAFNYYNPKRAASVVPPRVASVVPQSTGGGTYTCSCPSGSTTCASNQSCVCDFWGARCV